MTRPLTRKERIESSIYRQREGIKTSILLLRLRRMTTTSAHQRRVIGRAIDRLRAREITLRNILIDWH